MTICRELRHTDDAWENHATQDDYFGQEWICNTKMIFSLERRTWYCPQCGNSVRVPREQQSLNEYTR